MFQSLRYSQWFLRAGLAFVFIWFGIDKLIDPQYWLDAWVPQAMENAARGIGIGGRDLMNLLGILEVLIGLSLATGFFMRYFAIVGAAFLVVILATHGFTEVAVRDIGLLGALLALVVWPERTYA